MSKFWRNSSLIRHQNQFQRESLDYVAMPLLGCSMHMTKTLFFRFVCPENLFFFFFLFPSILHQIVTFPYCWVWQKFQVSVNDEGRGMWKVYLDMKEYAAALANCRDPLQRDQVYLMQVISNWNLSKWSTYADYKPLLQFLIWIFKHLTTLSCLCRLKLHLLLRII